MQLIEPTARKHRQEQVISLAVRVSQFSVRRLEDTLMMLTVRDRLALADGLTVRGSSIRRRLETVSAASPAQPPDIDRNEPPLPRPGLRLIELERARREQRETATAGR